MVLAGILFCAVLMLNTCGTISYSYRISMNFDGHTSSRMDTCGGAILVNSRFSYVYNYISIYFMILRFEHEQVILNKGHVYVDSFEIFSDDFWYDSFQNRCDILFPSDILLLLTVFQFHQAVLFLIL